MGYSYDVNPPDYKKQFIDQIEILRESRLRAALIIHRVNLSHSAVYFCSCCFQVQGPQNQAGQRLSVLRKLWVTQDLFAELQAVTVLLLLVTSQYSLEGYLCCICTKFFCCPLELHPCNFKTFSTFFKLQICHSALEQET